MSTSTICLPYISKDVVFCPKKRKDDAEFFGNTLPDLIVMNGWLTGEFVPGLIKLFFFSKKCKTEKRQQ